MKKTTAAILACTWQSAPAQPPQKKSAPPTSPPPSTTTTTAINWPAKPNACIHASPNWAHAWTKRPATMPPLMGVGMILFWPALFALGGTKKQEAEWPPQRRIRSHRSKWPSPKTAPGPLARQVHEAANTAAAQALRLTASPQGTTPNPFTPHAPAPYTLLHTTFATPSAWPR